jgi:WD40 repeat protein
MDHLCELSGRFAVAQQAGRIRQITIALSADARRGTALVARRQHNCLHGLQAREIVENVSDGGNSEELTSENLAESDPTWSPEGLLAFSRIDQVHPENMELKLYDRKTRKLSTIPMSEPVFGPRWSPDGKSMAVISSDNTRLLLMDMETHKMRDLADTMGEIGYLSWSRDSEYVYFDTLLTPEPAYYRVRVKDAKIEKILSLKNVRVLTGQFGPGSWTGIDPNQNVLFVRDLSVQEIYALDVEYR